MSKYADEGSCAHALAAMCLRDGTDAAAYIGRLIELEDYEHAKLSPSNAHRWMRCPGSHALEAERTFTERFYTMEVSEEMAADVHVYVSMVRDRIEARKLAGAVEVILLVERELRIDHLTGEDKATGTADVVLISIFADGSAMLDVIDLKFGKRVVVPAEDNEQLLIYCSGLLIEFDLVYDIQRVCLTIHQPRIWSEPSDWEIEAQVVRDFEAAVVTAAKLALTAAEFADNWRNDGECSYLLAGEKQCRFCDAKATCPAASKVVTDAVGNEFEVLVDPNYKPAPLPYLGDVILAAKMQAVDFVESWCKAVRGEVERRLLEGEQVPGFKLVAGRKGARKWTDDTAVEDVFRSMRLKREEMYDFKLISPTTAEKLLKESPKRWNKVKEFITQSEGGKSVAPESDKRPAIQPDNVTEDFEELAG